MALEGQISCQSTDISLASFAGSLPVFRRNARSPQSKESCLQSVVFPSSSAIMSASERIQTTETSEKIEYTVKQTAKVHLEKPQDPRSSLWLSVVKWVVGIFLFVSVLTCLVASKISLLSIAHYHEKDLDQNQETVFIMIVLTLMIPEAVSFLKACWTSLFRANHKWPRGRAVLVVSLAYSVVYKRPVFKLQYLFLT